MKTVRTALASLGVLAFLALATTAANASAMDVTCSGTATSCGFGTLVTTLPGSLSGGGHNATFTEDVFKNGSVYTYVLQIQNTGSALGSAKISTASSSDNFNCASGGSANCLDYGIVSGGITNSTMLGETSSAFAFGTLSVTVQFASTLSGGSYLTFYVQGGAPVTGTFNVGNGSSTTNSSNALAAPEPNVLTLLGSLLLMLVLGMPLASRLRTRTA